MHLFSSITESEDFTEFDCGNTELNVYLHQLALHNHQRRLGATTLLRSSENRSLIGFYTLCLCHIEKTNLPRKFGGNLPIEIPAIKLARLAIDIKFQKKGYGSILLAHALRNCYLLSENYGGYIVLIDAKKDAVKFYEKYGLKLIKASDTEYLMGIRSKDIPKYFNS